jgi:CRP/FNR family transcriptional regulator, cyclic AMP receptor protein
LRRGSLRATLCPMSQWRPANGRWLFDQLVGEVRAGTVKARIRSFAKGEVVFHEDDPGDTIHLINKGLFAVRTSTSGGRSLIINVLAPGDIFGEFALFSPGGRRTSDVSALIEGETVAVERDALRAALIARPELVEGLMSSVVVKAESTRRRLVELLSISADLRVLRALLFVNGLSQDDEPVPLTQQDLSSLAATTRPTANRVLREEAARGTLTLSRGRVTVVDEKRLAKRARVDLPMR